MANLSLAEIRVTSDSTWEKSGFSVRSRALSGSGIHFASTPPVPSASPPSRGLPGPEIGSDRFLADT